jgi:NADPH-dependent curcumin reductase CurA
VQNSLAPAEPQALLARTHHAAGVDGIEVLRVRLADFEQRRGEFLRDAVAWHGAGRIASKDHVVEGIANAPSHVLLTLQGGNFGRPLVSVV